MAHLMAVIVKCFNIKESATNLVKKGCRNSLATFYNLKKCNQYRWDDTDHLILACLSEVD